MQSMKCINKHNLEIVIITVFNHSIIFLYYCPIACTTLSTLGDFMMPVLLFNLPVCTTISWSDMAKTMGDVPLPTFMLTCNISIFSQSIKHLCLLMQYNDFLTKKKTLIFKGTI